MNRQRQAVEEVTEEEFDELMRYKRVLDWEQYIHADPKIAFGKPVVRGTRMAVEFLLGLYAAGWTDAMVLDSYPHLTQEDLRAVFAYAAECVSERRATTAQQQTR
jgi:uncharacterized protein (DUF433 family)